jgi:hypothetical protein
MGNMQMSVKERRLLEVLALVRDRDLGLVKAAELLGLSYRQVKRIWARTNAGLMSGWSIGCVGGLRTIGRLSFDAKDHCAIVGRRQ